MPVRDSTTAGRLCGMTVRDLGDRAPNFDDRVPDFDLPVRDFEMPVRDFNHRVRHFEVPVPRNEPGGSEFDRAGPPADRQVTSVGGGPAGRLCAVAAEVATFLDGSNARGRRCAVRRTLNKEVRIHIFRMALSIVALALTLAAPVLRAQQRDSARAGVRTGVRTDVAPGDTTGAPSRAVASTDAPPISPRRAFLYSILVPGLGQAALDRRYTGAAFALIEGFSLALLHRSQDDLRIARAFQGDSVPLSWQVDPVTGIGVRDAKGDPVVATWRPTRYTGDLVRARALHVEDWVAIVIFNHLFAGADAFVAAHLWDLPAHVSLRAAPLPRGGAGLTASLSFR